MSRAYIDPRFGDEVMGFTCEAQLLWYVLLTHPIGQLVPGLLRIGIPTLVDERRLTVDVVTRGLEALKAGALLVQDEERRLIQLPKAPGYFPKPGPDQLRGWWRQWQTMPESPLKYSHVECLRVACSLRGKSPIVDVWAATFGTTYSDDGSVQPECTDGLPLFKQLHRHPPGGVRTLTDTDPDPPPDRDQDQDRLPDPERSGAKILTMPGVDRTNRLWTRQEQLRVAVLGAAPEKPTSANLERLAACLEATGAGDDQVELVLVELQREALEKGTDYWFDGRRNWSLEVFRGAQARAKKPRKGNGLGHFKATADVQYPDGMVDLNLVR